MEPEKDIFEQWREKRESQSWIKRQINKLSLWWKFDCQYMFRNFKIGVKNLYYWLPVIWKDRNWDHRYILEILKHKLESQSKYIGDRDIHTRAKRDAEVMMTCVRLIDKVKEEYYRSEHLDYYKTKNWFETSDDEGYCTWESRIVEENFNDYFEKYPLIYKRVINGEGWVKIEDENDKQRIASNIAHINHNRARKLLFNIMENKIERWWD